MKILHIIHHFVDTSRRGSELHTDALCRRQTNKHDVAVLYTSPALAEGKLERRDLDGLPTFVLGARASWEQAKLQGRSRRAERAFGLVLREWRPDLIHFQHLLLQSLGLPTIATQAGVPSLLTLHDFWLLCPQINLLDHRRLLSWPINRRNCVACCEASIRRPYPYSWRRLWGWEPSLIARRAARAWYLRWGRPRQVGRVFRDVELFIAPSRHVRDRFVEEGLPPSKVVLCGHGIDHDIFPADFQRTPRGARPLRCGFIGAVAAHKGIEVLLEAFETVEDAILTVYGAAPPAYASRARDGKLRFAGEIGEAEKAKVFAEMDVLIVPSIWFENSSLVTLEAFLFGVPVIASDIGALPELVHDGQSGLLFKVGDARDLRTKINRLARDRGEVRRLAAHVPLVKSIQEYATEIEHLYERVLARRRGA